MRLSDPVSCQPCLQHRPFQPRGDAPMCANHPPLPPCRVAAWCTSCHLSLSQHLQSFLLLDLSYFPYLILLPYSEDRSFPSPLIPGQWLSLTTGAVQRSAPLDTPFGFSPTGGPCPIRGRHPAFEPWLCVLFGKPHSLTFPISGASIPGSKRTKPPRLVPGGLLKPYPLKGDLPNRMISFRYTISVLTNGPVNP